MTINDISATILLLAMIGALIGVFGHRKLLARRIGAGLIALDVIKRLILLLLNIIGGELKVSALLLFWALIEILLIIKFWKTPKVSTN